MKHPVFRIVLVSLCTLIVLGTVLCVALRPTEPNHYPNAAYTATEIGKMFPGFMYFDFGYNPNCNLVYAPSADELPKAFAQKKKGNVALPVILQKALPELNADEFDTVLSPILARLASAMELPIPTYLYKDTENTLRLLTPDYTSPQLNGLIFSAVQDDRMHTVSLEHHVGRSQALILNGIEVQVDQRLSDQKMIDSLAPIKDVLFDIFGVEYKDALVVRKYYPSADHGVTFLHIYFYDRTSFVNQYCETPQVDYIRLTFENYNNFDGDIVSDTILTVANVEYKFFRNGAEDEFLPSQQERMLTLREAEALLYDGQTFANRHFCSLCAEHATEIDFRDYDRVSLIYRFSTFTDDPMLYTGIPFYVFYKEYQTTDSGNKCYAEAYVPAIEFNGYEDYLKHEQETHK
jgi:hypothetical protein